MNAAVSLLAGFLAINLVLTLAVQAAERWGWGAGVAVAVCAAIACACLSIVVKRPSLAWASVLMLAGGALAAMDAAEGAELARLPHAEGIAVADAPSHATAGSFTFRDGAVRADLWGRATRRSRSGSRHDYRAAPVVAADWVTSDPVTVWAVCDDYYGCATAWAQPFRAGIRPTGLVAKELALAVADAETDRGLTSAPQAVMIRWVASVTAERSRVGENISFGVRVWNYTWLVTYVIGAGVLAWRRRRREIVQSGA